MARAKEPLKLMVSSSVYGIEDYLDQIFALLGQFGYEVWMSHKGTIPIYPNQTALESCLTAVENCDLFLSIITPRYGSGVVQDQLSITHQELLKAIEKKRPRWILAHNNVIFARSMFRKLGAKDGKQRTELLEKLGFSDEKSMKALNKREELVIDDFRVIDMYDTAIRNDLVVYQDREGNWVQKYSDDRDINLFATFQFSRYRQVESYVNEQLKDVKGITARVSDGAKK